MISREQFGQLVDGTSVDAEISRLSRQGGGWLTMAQRLSRRIYRTLDWTPLGGSDARYRLLATRGEAAIFWDNQLNNRVMKLRGLEINGFDGGGFGCILKKNARGFIDLTPGTLEEALDREALSWTELGFGCCVEEMITDGKDIVGLFLSQKFITGSAPSESEITQTMEEKGWKSLTHDEELAPKLRRFGWQKGDIMAVDANTTNFIKSVSDGKVYPIDLIIYHRPT